MTYTTRQSQTARILKLFQEKGYATNIELNRICFRYAARIHELREEGHVIVTHRVSEGLYHFVYKGQRKIAQELPKIKPAAKKSQKEGQLSLL